MYDYPTCTDEKYIYFIASDKHSTLLHRINKKNGTVTKLFDIDTISKNHYRKSVRNVRSIVCDETYIYLYISGETNLHPYMFKIHKNNFSDVTRFVL
jgi:hypothetical protein